MSLRRFPSSRFASSLLAGLVLGLSLFSCVNPQSPSDSPVVPPQSSASYSPIWTELPADFVPSTTWMEGFEAGQPSDSSWSYGGDTSAISIETSPSIPHGGAALVMSAIDGGGAKLSASMRKNLELSAAANLRFWIRTDIGTTVDTDISFSVDDQVRGSWNGLDGTWQAVDTLLQPGSHSLVWTLTRNSNLYIVDHANAVWIDDVSLCADTVALVQTWPRASQELVEGTSSAWKALARRGDGSIKTDAPIQWSVLPGTGMASVDGNGLVSVATTGSVEVVASSGSIRSTGCPISILPADWLDRSVTYRGVAYAGKASGGSGSPLLAGGGPVTIQEPTVASFDADAFFTLRGSDTGTAADQYAWVLLVKDGGSSAERSSYFVRGNFALRIWLRFGGGAYHIYIYPIEVTAAGDNLDYEGDITAWSYGSPTYAFAVNNTNGEDGRFAYPSDPLQADALPILNLAANILVGKTADRERLLALHDYVVSSLHYDDDSLVAGQRKKQDALSALANGTGVCEGYTSLFGSLARAAGYSVKAVAGTGDGESHAWNLVFLDGAWSMIDCTWDDPGPTDGDPSVVYRTYFLVGLGGIDGDHIGTDDRVGRSIVSGELGRSASGFGSWPAGTY